MNYDALKLDVGTTSHLWGEVCNRVNFDVQGFIQF